MLIDYHLGKVNVVVDALSRKTTIELQAMFTWFRIGNDGNMIAKLQVKLVLLNQIKKAELIDKKLFVKLKLSW